MIASVMASPTDNLDTLCAYARRLADAARRETLPHFRNGASVSDKAAPHAGTDTGVWFDPVTEADHAAERALRDLVGADYPDHGLIGEEFGVTIGAAPWRWVIDPIDGTRAFVCGATSWATLIGLEYDEKPVLGLIDQPYLDERWLGVNGQTTFERAGVSSPCRASGQTDLGAARLSTTDPRAGECFSEDEARAFARLGAHCRVARFSLDAYAYALLASGEIDLVVESGLKHHDYAALVPVIEGAGAIITNWRGGPLGSDGRGEALAAASPQLHKAAMEILAG